MQIWSFLPAVIVFFIWLGLILGLLYLVYKRVSKIIALKQEHNELLKEIIETLNTRYKE